VRKENISLIDFTLRRAGNFNQTICCCASQYSARRDILDAKMVMSRKEEKKRARLMQN